ncbi:MAG: hypothetical protein JNJ54_02105 [Myxococcaceae bacterium]|nr:hypothetical protein [Myxococcaceae bacterium]
MSLIVTGGVALAYTAGVIGLHRWAVWRRRHRADNFPALDWLDWDTLLAGSWPAAPPRTEPTGPAPRDGGPPPRCLSVAPPEGREAAHALLLRLVQQEVIAAAEFERAGFSGGEARWLAGLSERVHSPRAVLDRLEAQAPVSAAEAYLLEWLSLHHAVSPLSVEWQVYASKRRLSVALRRFGDVPALYFARAHAASLLGFTQSVLDDLGRAVFFSREAPFYVDAALSMPFVEEQRPPLARACRDAKSRSGGDRLEAAGE